MCTGQPFRSSLVVWCCMYVLRISRVFVFSVKWAEAIFIHQLGEVLKWFGSTRSFVFVRCVNTEWGGPSAETRSRWRAPGLKTQEFEEWWKTDCWERQTNVDWLRHGLAFRRNSDFSRPFEKKSTPKLICAPWLAPSKRPMFATIPALTLLRFVSSVERLVRPVCSLLRTAAYCWGAVVCEVARRVRAYCFTYPVTSELCSPQEDDHMVWRNSKCGWTVNVNKKKRLSGWAEEFTCSGLKARVVRGVSPFLRVQQQQYTSQTAVQHNSFCSIRMISSAISRKLCIPVSGGTLCGLLASAVQLLSLC